ncbi:MAG: hypothetical protein ACPGYX_11390 [Oceanobacter sp.]
MSEAEVSLLEVPLFITAFFILFSFVCTLMLMRSIRIGRDIDGYLTNSRKGQKLVEQEGYDRARNLVKKIGVPLGVLLPWMLLMISVSSYFYLVDAIANGTFVIK